MKEIVGSDASDFIGGKYFDVPIPRKKRVTITKLSGSYIP